MSSLFNHFNGPLIFMHLLTIPKIIATTTLCLAALGLSSCYTNIHQYVWQKAKVTEGGEWLDNQYNIELFSDGKHIYAKGNQGNMRGCSKGAPFGTFLPLHGSGAAYPYYAPIKESATPIYYRLSPADAAKVRKAHATGTEYVWIEPRPAHATPLPASARPLREKGQTLVSYPIINGESLQRARYIPYTTDSHKYYAYPLGVLTAVAVDAPLTLATNAVALGACAIGAAIGLPCAGVYAIYESCTQNAPDAETTTKSTTPSPQNSPST